MLSEFLLRSPEYSFVILVILHYLAGISWPAIILAIAVTSTFAMINMTRFNEACKLACNIYYVMYIAFLLFDTAYYLCFYGIWKLALLAACSVLIILIGNAIDCDPVKRSMIVAEACSPLIKAIFFSLMSFTEYVFDNKYSNSLSRVVMKSLLTFLKSRINEYDLSQNMKRQILQFIKQVECDCAK